MVSNAVRSIWDEPRAPHPPARVWRDWVLVAVLVATAILEASLRHDLIWRPVALVLAVALVFPLLWRRTHPLAAVAVTFGVLIAVLVAALFGADGPVGLDTLVYVLLFPYALFRWGSGREAVIGLGILLVAYVLGIASDYTGLVDAALASVFAAVPRGARRRGPLPDLLPAA